jgi:hypothetical protein
MPYAAIIRHYYAARHAITSLALSAAADMLPIRRCHYYAMAIAAAVHAAATLPLRCLILLIIIADILRYAMTIAAIAADFQAFISISLLLLFIFFTFLLLPLFSLSPENMRMLQRGACSWQKCSRQRQRKERRCRVRHHHTESAAATAPAFMPPAPLAACHGAQARTERASLWRARGIHTPFAEARAHIRATR